MAEALTRTLTELAIPLPEVTSVAWLGPHTPDEARAALQSVGSSALSQSLCDPVPGSSKQLRRPGHLVLDTYLDVVDWALRHAVDPAGLVVVQLPGASPSERVVAADLLGAHGATVARRIVEDGVPANRRIALLQWAERLPTSDPLQAVRIAHAVAEGDEDVDPGLGRIALQGWVALGAPTRAMEWVSACGFDPASAVAIRGDLEATARELATQRRGCLDANVEHLETIAPALAARIRQTPLAGIDMGWLPQNPWLADTDEHRAPVRRADYPLLLSVSTGEVRALNAPESPLWFVQQLRAAGDVMRAHACIGDLCRLDALANVTGNRLVSTAPNRRQVVHGLIPDLAAFKALASLDDLRPWLEEGAVELYWGPGAAIDLEVHLRRHPARPAPAIRYAVDAELHAAFDQLVAARTVEADRHSQLVASGDGAHRTQAIKEKLRRGAPLRIWTWSSRHTTVLQHTARDLGRAFEALGHRFDLLIEEDDRDLVDRRALHESLARYEPDVMFMLDHVRPEYGDLLPKGVPLVSWFLDELPMLRSPALIEKLGPLDLSFAWSPSLASSFRDLGYPHCAAMPFAVDPDMYAVDPNAPSEASVAFATHLSLPLDPEFAPGFIAAVQDLLRDWQVLPSGNVAIIPVVDEVVRALGLRPNEHQNAELRFCATAVSRHVDRLRVADAIREAGLPLACYGRGWDEIERFAPLARGCVRPGQELRSLYQKHKVVLHVNTHCNVHPRVLEAMSSGGFVLARSDGDYDYAAGGLADHFEIGREICLFADNRDLVRTVERAFEDEPWRRAFVEAGRARVLESHTFRHRAETMLSAVRDAMLGARQRNAA